MAGIQIESSINWTGIIKCNNRDRPIVALGVVRLTHRWTRSLKA